MAAKLLILCTLFLLSCSIKESPQYDLIIANVNLINGTGQALQPNMNIYVKEGKIERIDKEKISQKENVIDATDKYLTPGLFDCHVHTTDYENDFPKFIHFGVTSIFVTGGSLCTNEYYATLRARGEQDSIPAPRVFHTSQHFTMEGRHPVKTYKTPNWVDGQSVFFLKDTLQIEQLVKQVATQPIQGIKLTIEDGPQPPWVERMPQVFIQKVKREAEKNGLEVFAHISDNIELETAINANIKNLVHFTGVDLDFERDSLLLSKVYQSNFDWVTTLMIDKTFLYPLHKEWIEENNLVKIYGEKVLKAADNPGYIFRAEDNLAFWKEYLKTDSVTLKDIAKCQVDDMKVLYENGVNMVLGTDTGDAFALPGIALQEEMQLFELGGMEPLDIIKMGTLNAAKMMKVEEKLGSIEVGKIADMLLLNKNPLESIENMNTIQTVFKNGKSQKRIDL